MNPAACFSIFFFALLVSTNFADEEVRFDFEKGQSREVPAPFLYDPLSASSSPNKASQALYKEINFDGSAGSFTLEAYVKPSAIPSESIDIIEKIRTSEEETRLGLGVRWLPNFKQSYWGGMITPAKSSRETRWSSGHFVSISRLREETLGWRHLALVYDEKTLTVTIWLDHWQSFSETLDEPLRDDSPLFRVNPDFPGLIDSIRYTNQALGPDQFLRAIETALKGVDFDHEEKVLPFDAGHLSVRRNFGAVGDGVTDDTRAIQKAFDDLANHQASGKGTYVLYFPAGTYLISDTVKWSRFLRVMGESSESTIIRLVDEADGFSNSGDPKPVVAASGVPGSPGTNKAVNGSTIANWFHNFTVDSGKGNPGAVGVEYHSNNKGSLENVVIRSGDGSGAIGLDLTHKTNGPTLIAGVEVHGFDVGIETKYMEYSVTMENVLLREQNEVGILNRSNILAIRNLISHNKVPALQSKSGSDLVTMLDSKLTGGDPDKVAIESDGGLYLARIEVDGYGHSLAKKTVSWFPRKKPSTESVQEPPLVGDIEEYMGSTPITSGGKKPRSLSLPIEAEPLLPSHSLDQDWISVRNFESLVEGEGKSEDWSAALEAAFSTGKSIVYFPRGNYPVSRTVLIPSTVTRLYGMDNQIFGRGKIDKEHPKYEDRPATLRVEEKSSAPLFIDHFSVDMIEHASTRPLVLRHANFTYRAEPGSGDVFLRDALGPSWSFVKGQNVWARQWNVESHADGPCILADGANLWSLGFKTEYGSQKLRATGGAAVEIFGGFIYPVVKGIPKDRPVFEIIDSEFSGQWGVSVYTAGHFLQVRDVQAGIETNTSLREARQIGPRFRYDWFSN